MNRPVRPLPQPLRLSAPERPEFQIERLSLILSEWAPIARRTWAESPWRPADAPFDPDWDRYLAMDMAGMLRLLTVRLEGVLIGYVLSVVYPHLHYLSTPWAMLDSYWLEPAFRRGWTGVRMFREHEAILRENGVKVIHHGFNVRFAPRRMQALMKRLGYEPIELIYAKVL